MNTPLAFPANAAVPIVGQPFAVKSWFPTVMGRCQCGGDDTAVLLIGTMPTACPSCGRKFLVGQVQFTLQTGQLQIGIGLVHDGVGQAV